MSGAAEADILRVSPNPTGSAVARGLHDVATPPTRPDPCSHPSNPLNVGRIRRGISPAATASTLKLGGSGSPKHPSVATGTGVLGSKESPDVGCRQFPYIL